MRKFASLLAMLLLFFTAVFAQTRTITGKVFDATDGTPLAGVTVAAGKTGVQTDSEGNFSITVSPDTKSLTITFVGYQTQQVKISSESNYSVPLSSSNQSLEEVVVVGYGTQKKKEVTGNLASVSGAAVSSRPIQSFEQALGGRAAGVQVTVPNGVLNAPPVVRIRGTNSISLSSSPLYVIDGVPVYTGDGSSTSASANVLSSINPEDIESIDIAKDAAAAAIYGSRAANGVIFVTTKKGKLGKARVSLNSWVGWSSPQRLPELLDAFEYTDYKNQALKNSGAYNDNPATPTSNNYFALTNGPDGQPINTNWYDEVYRTGVAHNHSLSVSGATEATNYYFSLGYGDQQGIIKKNDFKRASILANVTHKVGNVLTLGTKINYSNVDAFAAASSGSLPGEAFNTAGLGRAALVTAPNVAALNNDGSYNYSGTLIGVMNNKTGQVGFNNPRIQMDQNRTNAEVNVLLADAFAELKPFNWVTLRSQYSLNYLYVDNEIYYSPISGDAISSNGSATSIFAKNKRWVWSNTIQFDKTFNEHRFSLLGGTEQQKSDNQSYGINRINVSDPDYTNIQGGWATPNSTGMGVGENYLLSYFGRLNYNFNKKYYLSGNLRRDGASQLGANVKYGTFWGVSAGWEVAEENFFKSISNVFSSLKLRGSYGKVGNISGLGQYASLTTFNSGLYGGGGTLVFNQAGNPNLTWETSTKMDVGINYGFLGNRITGELTYYNNDIDGLILYVPSPPSAGLPTTIPTNIGSMYNKGFEFLISADVIEGKNFSWSTSLNLNYNKNEVTSLAPDIDNLYSSSATGLETANNTVVGQPIGMLFVTRTAGVDPATGRRIFINKDGREVYFQHVAPSGQFRFSYADGTQAPSVSNADAKIYKQTLPKLLGGFENTFRYKNIQLNAMFTYQFGNYVYYGTYAGLKDQRFWNNTVEVLDAWEKPGDVSETPKPYFGDNISNGSSFPLDVNVFKGDFVKLRTLTLSYNFPKTIFGNGVFRNARFYVSGNNLLIITKYPGPDPEVSSNGDGTLNFGIDRNTVANQRTITVGINVGF